MVVFGCLINLIRKNKIRVKNKTLEINAMKLKPLVQPVGMAGKVLLGWHFAFHKNGKPYFSKYKYVPVHPNGKKIPALIIWEK